MICSTGTPLGRLLHRWASHHDGTPIIRLPQPCTDVAVLGAHADGSVCTSILRAWGQNRVFVGCLSVASGRNKIFQIFDRGRQWQPSRSACVDAFAYSGGTRICKAALLQVRGDWEFMVQNFRFRSYGNRPKFCWMCAAERSGELGMGNFSADALHRETLLTHRSYLEGLAAEQQNPSALFRCPGFQLDYCIVDGMHAGDLGTFQDAIGSLFWLEISNRQWHRNARAGLLWLRGQLRDYYAANDDVNLTRLQTVTAAMLRAKEGFPTLKAKAAETRHVVRFALIISRLHASGAPGRAEYRFRAGSRLRGDSEAYRRFVVLCFEGLVEYQMACNRVPFDEGRCTHAMLQFLQSYGALSRMWRRGLEPAEAHHKLPWHVRPKAHILQHLVMDKIQLWGSALVVHDLKGRGRFRNECDFEWITRFENGLAITNPRGASQNLII